MIIINIPGRLTACYDQLRKRLILQNKIKTTIINTVPDQHFFFFFDRLRLRDTTVLIQNRVKAYSYTPVIPLNVGHGALQVGRARSITILVNADAL